MNNDNQECPTADQLAIATKAMQAINVSDVPVEAIRLTGHAMMEASRRRIWRSYAARGAVAAVIVLVLFGLAILMPQTSPSLALAEVARRVNATKTLRAVVVDPREGGTLFVSGSHRRFEGKGAVVIADSATGQEVMLDVKSKLAYRIPYRTGRVLDFYGIFRELATAASTPIEEYVDKAGRRYSGFSGKTAVKVDGKETWKVDAKVWSDPTTKLPVRLEIRPTDAGGQVVMLIEQIEFDVPLDDAIFDMTVPAGYTIKGLSADQLKPPPSEKVAATLTIMPSVGIGEVKFGMSREQIVAILGEPEFTIRGVYLSYPSKGLQLVLVGREPDKLGMIIANPGDAASLVRNEFLGQTDNGIRTGSSTQDVFDAYGKPDTPLPSDKNMPKGLKIARYEKLGMMFSFVDDKVKQIIATRTN